VKEAPADVLNRVPIGRNSLPDVVVTHEVKVTLNVLQSVHIAMRRVNFRAFFKSVLIGQRGVSAANSKACCAQQEPVWMEY
jgi:hypothetical protein